ncbi:MAG: protein kinase, partial [Verrucomicrobia bacterium]|nr:protein kinase [Verrucomicrobiota bacterium]
MNNDPSTDKTQLETSAGARSQTDSAAPTPSAQLQIPDHQLLRCIGRGSYGEVWLARNIMGTYRAVKVVYRKTFGDDARPYEREFTGIQRFEPISRSHEGLVDVLQVGRNDPAGYFYYVMELADDASPVGKASSLPLPAHLDGDDAKQRATRETETSSTIPTRQSEIANPDKYIPKTLSKELHNRGRLPAEECLRLSLTLTSALGHLHKHGLIHRDIKPSNIIFVNGIPKLADIGLVADVAEARSFVGTEGFI